MPLTLNGTTGIAGANGSASTPAVQGEDTNTGVFFPAADTVAVATGGSERMRVDSSGNVGIGMSPTGRLSVRPSGTGSEDSHIGFGANLDTYITTGSDGIVVFREGNGAGVNTERARIDADGTLLIGRTADVSAATRLGLDATASISGFISETGPTTSVTHGRFYNGNGNVGNISTNGSATTYATSSDYRLKENVQPMQDALSVIAQLNPVTYTWKVDGSDGQGFIAHELQAVVPDCVSGEKDAVDAEGNPQYQGVDTSFLVATLVAAIKEQQATIDALVARVSALEAI
jgi:hypothetical protein